MLKAALILALFTAPAAQAQRAGCELTVYEHTNYRGETWRVLESTPAVEERWNDRISSLIITAGTWEFFEHAEYGGHKVTLRPGRYSWIGERLEDEVSSFRCIRPGR